MSEVLSLVWHGEATYSQLQHRGCLGYLMPELLRFVVQYHGATLNTLDHLATKTGECQYLFRTHPGARAINFQAVEEVAMELMAQSAVVPRLEFSLWPVVHGGEPRTSTILSNVVDRRAFLH